MVVMAKVKEIEDVLMLNHKPNCSYFGTSLGTSIISVPGPARRIQSLTMKKDVEIEPADSVHFEVKRSKAKGLQWEHLGHVTCNT